MRVLGLSQQTVHYRGLFYLEISGDLGENWAVRIVLDFGTRMYQDI